jgi:serine/threonine-protein kinase
MREATAIGKVKGKLSYMSPEQAQGQPIDRRSDVFSLGVVLYLATVGSHPFRRVGDSRHQQLSRLLQKRAKLPSELAPGYPPELEAIVMRALSRNPGDRFATADEMARRLQDWVLASGPLVTDQHIAQMVLKRGGAAILERSERIANLMVLQQPEAAAEEPVPSPNDPTLVPTTSRSGQSAAPERARNARATLRAVSTTLTAGALALAASLVFSSPTELRRTTLAAPSAQLVPVQPVAPAPTPVPAPPTTPAVANDAPSTASASAGTPSSSSARVPPAAPARAAKRSSSTARASAAAASKSAASKAAASKSAASKAKKQRSASKRKKTTRRDELYGIKRGR